MIISNFFTRSHTLRLTRLLIVFFAMTLLFGCGEDEEETSLLKPEKTAINFMGEMKRAEITNAPAAPQMPGAGTPTVTEVNYYSDAQLTKPLTGIAQPGTTIFTKVVFSEAMQHTVSDAGNAKPILFYVIGVKEVRYRIKSHGAAGENFQSGDGKPLQDGTDDYICRYTVLANDQGAFALKVGKSSVDTDGNRLADHYVHNTTLQLGQPTAPEVTEVNYYSDWQLTKPLTGTVQAGTTIFTKVVFSEPMQHIVSDDEAARPILFYVIGEREIRHHMKPHGAAGENFQSGDSKPLHGGVDDYICKYTVGADDTGEFTLRVGKGSVGKNGNTLADTYTHPTSLSVGSGAETPQPEQATPPEPAITQLPDVVEISHYSNGGLTKPLTGTIQAGKIVFTKVVFSDNAPYVVANDASALPDIRYVINGKDTQYDVLMPGTRRANVRSGDCVAIMGGTTTFLCRKSIPEHATGEFSVHVADDPFEGPSLTIEAPPPPPTPAEQSVPTQEERQPDTEQELPPPPMPPKQVGKTALQLEAEAAEAAGLVGNSPLVRAIKIANRISDRIKFELNPRYTDREPFDRETAFQYGRDYNKVIAEETGWPGSLFTEELPDIYFLTLGLSQHDRYSRYWMTIEFLRLTFETPGASKYDYFVQFAESVRAGRISLQYRKQ